MFGGASRVADLSAEPETQPVSTSWKTELELQKAKNSRFFFWPFLAICLSHCFLLLVFFTDTAMHCRPFDVIPAKLKTPSK